MDFAIRFTQNNTSSHNHCVCPSGYGGNLCEQNECSFDMEEFYFDNQIDLCNKKECDDENFCINGGKCHQFGFFKICECDKLKYYGTKCEFECIPSCIDKICSENNLLFKQKL
ncbi:hypothetical protein MXB_3011 [Myxobolus squamalis]|nr:hypothetical protein MXB_3011 [Myxobolus squamalis]